MAKNTSNLNCWTVQKNLILDISNKTDNSYNFQQAKQLCIHIKYEFKPFKCDHDRVYKHKYKQYALIIIFIDVAPLVRCAMR